VFSRVIPPIASTGIRTDSVTSRRVIQSDRRFSGGFEDWAKDNEVRADHVLPAPFRRRCESSIPASGQTDELGLPAIHFQGK
jgi:hypothetical protein